MLKLIDFAKNCEKCPGFISYGEGRTFKSCPGHHPQITLYRTAARLYPHAMDNVRSASQPDLSATVMASAGTGKTWLLVTRAVRLLLAGTAPDAILAVTFTRKAAAEMAERLMQRLAELAGADEAGRRALLGAMGIAPDAALLRCAADLYERQLRQPRQIRFTTFHAFCQELLRRFPLEAEVPAGFDVLESPGLLQQEAWDALLAEATAAPAARFEQCSSLHTVRSALRQFLDHRSDWWAYIGDEPAPVRYASERLADALGIDSAADPLATVFSISAQQELREYAELLTRHGTSTFAVQRIADRALPPAQVRIPYQRGRAVCAQGQQSDGENAGSGRTDATARIAYPLGGALTRRARRVESARDAPAHRGLALCRHSLARSLSAPQG